MKFKDYLNSLVSRRKSTPSSSKPQQSTSNRKNPTEPNSSADCHYDICGYDDNNGMVNEDQHTRTQILLARHAELVNTIVETRSPQESTFPSCAQCRIVRQCSPMMLSTVPPPLPPKISLEPQTPVLNRNYSSTLATCSPRRECQHHQKPTPQPYQQQHQPLYYQSPLTASQYSTPNPSVNSSSSSSLWTTTASLSKKQRSRIRTNPWIGKSTANNRTSTFIESINTFNHHASPNPSLSHPEYGIYDPTYRASPSGITHSESFPQTAPPNGSMHVINSPSPPTPAPTAALLPLLPSAPAPASSALLHQSDSGHGFSLASSRVIDSSSSTSPPSSSSSPDDTSADGMVAHEKQSYRQKKLTKKTSSISPLMRKRSPKRQINVEHNFYSNTISSDSGSLTRRTRARQKPASAAAHHRHQRSSVLTKTSPIKSSIDRKQQQSHSSSSQSIDDHFSLEFEEILENERSCKQRKEKATSTKLTSPAKSPFILPLDGTHIQLPPPPPILFTGTLTKTNSRAILKHIEEIENEIRLIKNLDLTHEDEEKYVFSPHAYPEEDIDLEVDSSHETEETEIKAGQPSIYDQVDQWVEKCLTTTNSTENPATLLHTECDHLSNTIKDYVGCVCPEDDRPTAFAPASEPAPELMIAFYLSSIPARTTKRTSSFIAETLKLDEFSTATEHLKATQECPF